MTKQTTIVVIGALRVKAPITTAADDILIFFLYFSKKISLDISCESSSKQTIDTVYEDLMCLKNDKK